MKATFAFSLRVINWSVALAVGLMLVFGVAATWRVLGAKTVTYLSGN